MTRVVNATVIDGALQLDQPLDLPNNSRVTVEVEVVSDQMQDEPTETEREAAWESFLHLIKERPIDSGGQRFTRDELHGHH